MRFLKEYWHAVEGNPGKEQQLKETLSGIIDDMLRYCPEHFYDAVYKLHSVAYGPHFSDSLAKMAVSKMRNVDGTNGEHWCKEQTDQLAAQYNIEAKADWYYTMNMLYSDFAQVIGNDANSFAKLAKAYMLNPDAPEGKVLNNWLAQMR